MPKSKYKKYVPVKTKDEKQNVENNIVNSRIYNEDNGSFELFFNHVRSISSLGDEERAKEFEKLRKKHNDVQPLCSTETYDDFFKDVIPGFRTITDPKEIEERQQIHDLGWDTLQEYAQKVLPINKPYEYPAAIDRFAQGLFFGLPNQEDKQKLYELTLQKADPSTGDKKMQEEYATLIKHSVDYMLKMQGQLERINKLDDKEFLKKIMPYIGLVTFMAATDDSLKFEGVSKVYDTDTQERIKCLNSVGTRSITRLQRILDTHYPAMAFKDETELTFTELNLSKKALSVIDEKVVNGISGLDMDASEATWTTGIITKGTLNINPIVYDKINKAFGRDVTHDNTLCDFVDADGNKIYDIEDVGIRLDQGELIYAQTKKNVENNIHDAELIPLYCGGSIKENRVLFGDEALKDAALVSKKKAYSVENELKKYDQKHPRPTISWWDNLVAKVVTAVTFDNFETAAWSNYMRKTDDWEKARKAAKAEFTKKKEVLDQYATGKIPKKAQDKLMELRNENEKEYVADTEKKIINHFITDESKLNINASVNNMKEAHAKGDVENLARGMAEVIVTSAINEKLIKCIGSKQFANEFNDLTGSFNKEKEASKLLESDEFFEFFKSFNHDKIQDVYGVDSAKNMYQDYLKVTKEIKEKAKEANKQLDNKKPEIEGQQRNVN